MRVLVGCEESGRVRDALLALGHDAYSCDLLPTRSRPERHFQCDVLTILDQGWDMAIFHPVCRYLANSGVRWLHTDPSRWPKMFDGADFFLSLLNAPIPKVAVENLVMHKYAKRLIGRNADFSLQPYEHGDPFTKRTCFWTRNLPKIVPTNIVSERTAKVHLMPPGPDRERLRSETEPGVAAALAMQWGGRVGMPL